jgi:hypothetical protein
MDLLNLNAFPDSRHQGVSVLGQLAVRTIDQLILHLDTSCRSSKKKVQAVSITWSPITHKHAA